VLSQLSRTDAHQILRWGIQFVQANLSDPYGVYCLEYLVQAAFYLACAQNEAEEQEIKAEWHEGVRNYARTQPDIEIFEWRMHDLAKFYKNNR
jgi:hypothetical protein